jgi:hypothetical protein
MKTWHLIAEVTGDIVWAGWGLAMLWLMVRAVADWCMDRWLEPPPANKPAATPEWPDDKIW